MMEFELIHLGETDSTNRWLREHPDDRNVVVWTDYQTAGRGCGSNSWESRRGENLLFSVLLHPVWLRASQQFLLSMAVANALHRTLEDYLEQAVEVKWPNDIYVGGRKICGILIETTLHGTCMTDCIVGIGLNVNQTVFESDAPNPVSMRQLRGCAVNREGVLATVLHHTADLLDHWDAQAVGTEYRAHLYRREGFHRYGDAGGTFMAQLVGVEDDGHLVLHLREGQERRYAFKEVKFLETINQ